VDHCQWLVEDGKELTTHPGLLTPVDGIRHRRSRRPTGHRPWLCLISIATAEGVITAMCSPHCGVELLVDGTGVWVSRDAEHNRANLLARFIANRNQAPAMAFARLLYRRQGCLGR
jgi:hypothetical protein